MEWSIKQRVAIPDSKKMIICESLIHWDHDNMANISQTTFNKYIFFNENV